MISILGDAEALETFGSRIRTERLRRNLSQSHLASIIGVSLPTYRKIESGDGSVEFRHVVRALAALDYAERLAALIPEAGPELHLEDLLAPERRRASRRPSS